MTERKTIKGEIEGWGREPNKFKGGRGSLGIKVEGEWHNLLGKLETLEKVQKEFPKGSIVQFEEEENKRGYLDIVEDSIKKIEKAEAYEGGIKQPSGDRKDKDYVTCFMAAVDVIVIKIAYSFRKNKPLSAFEITNETMQMTEQLYLDYQKVKEKLKREGKW